MATLKIKKVKLHLEYSVKPADMPDLAPHAVSRDFNVDYDILTPEHVNELAPKAIMGVARVATANGEKLTLYRVKGNKDSAFPFDDVTSQLTSLGGTFSVVFSFTGGNPPHKPVTAPFRLSPSDRLVKKLPAGLEWKFLLIPLGSGAKILVFEKPAGGGAGPCDGLNCSPTADPATLSSCCVYGCFPPPPPPPPPTWHWWVG